MRNSFLGLASAFIVSSAAASAFGQAPQAPPAAPQGQPQLPQIPGLPPLQLPQIDPSQLPQIPGLTPAPAQPAPTQPGAQPAPPPPLIPGFPGFQPQPGMQPQPGAPAPGMEPQPGMQPGAPPPAPPKKKSSKKSTALEIGYLYATATAYGVGTGIWIDAVGNVTDPGLVPVAPVLFGAAAPIGVYLLDSPPLPKGLPSAVATGILIGAGESFSISLYQVTSANMSPSTTIVQPTTPGGLATTTNGAWDFAGITTAEWVGSTIGGAAGFAYWYLARPRPQQNLFYGSAALWGAAVGTAFGVGASSVGGGIDPVTHIVTPNTGIPADAVARGELVGYNLFLASSMATGAFWSPSWNQLGWMWLGFGIGAVASTPVYLFYAGSSNDDIRHGAIFQGVAATAGMAIGAIVGKPDKRSGRHAELEDEEHEDEYWNKQHHFARILGGGLMPTPGGIGANISGQLW